MIEKDISLLVHALGSARRMADLSRGGAATGWSLTVRSIAASLCAADSKFSQEKFLADINNEANKKPTKPKSKSNPTLQPLQDR